MPRKIIAIDGAAATGKTTIGIKLAEVLKAQFLDTGIYYRVCALHLTKTEQILDNSNIVKAASIIAADFILNSSPKTCIDLVGSLYNSDITSLDLIKNNFPPAIIKVAQCQKARQILTKAMQNWALENTTPLVAVGRDAGSSIFPKANYKFFFEAPLQIREQRRGAQFQDNIAARDAGDKSLQIRTPNAISIDTYKNNIQQSLNLILTEIKAQDATLIV